ncbi:hypothetical protein [Streptomyces sp. SAI-218]|uniref:hypothetical protein n=1 Tax=Streptomyces sp. SAI-218 TaxID=3377736 RepID=UPI003C79B9E8
MGDQQPGVRVRVEQGVERGDGGLREPLGVPQDERAIPGPSRQLSFQRAAFGRVDQLRGARAQQLTGQRGLSRPAFAGQQHRPGGAGQPGGALGGVPPRRRGARQTGQRARPGPRRVLGRRLQDGHDPHDRALLPHEVDPGVAPCPLGQFGGPRRVRVPCRPRRVLERPQHLGSRQPLRRRVDQAVAAVQRDHRAVLRARRLQVGLQEDPFGPCRPGRQCGLDRCGGGLGEPRLRVRRAP